jgi:flagellar biogenesis protein FliO
VIHTFPRTALTLVAALLTVAAASGQSTAPYVRPAVAYEPDTQNRLSGAVLPVQFTRVEDVGRQAGEPGASTPARGSSEADPIKLRRRGDSENRSADDRRVPTATSSMVTVSASLAIVLGLFFVLVWITRKNMPRAMAGLSSQVVDVLGRAPLGQRQHMHLVRIGNKLLLVCVTPAGAHTLTEITDPAEVDQLVTLCQQNPSGSMTNSFRNVLNRLNGAPAASGNSPVDPQTDFEPAFDNPREQAAAAWEGNHVA